MVGHGGSWRVVEGHERWQKCTCPRPVPGPRHAIGRPATGRPACTVSRSTALTCGRALPGNRGGVRDSSVAAAASGGGRGTQQQQQQLEQQRQQLEQQQQQKQ